MKAVTVTELRGNIYKLLDEVLSTGVPLEVKKGRRKLRIMPVESVDKLKNLTYQPEVIRGDPEDLVHLEWEINLDLP